MQEANLAALGDRERTGAPTKENKPVANEDQDRLEDLVLEDNTLLLAKHLLIHNPTAELDGLVCSRIYEMLQRLLVPRTGQTEVKEEKQRWGRGVDFRTHFLLFSNVWRTMGALVSL